MPSPYPAGTLLDEIPRLAIFTLGVVLASWISGQQRQTEVLLERTRDELERKVQERTADLRCANGKLQEEIAERKAAQDALQTMQTELAHVSRVTLMGELTASIAHEVNQPLGAIMNYANACRRLLATKPEGKDEVDAALGRIVEDAHRASDVIARIRALAKKQPTEKVAMLVGDLIADVVAIANYEMRARGVTIRVELNEKLPPILVDRIQLQQVLLNLIINGSEAMESLPPPQRVIEISARQRTGDEPALVVCVRDHGTGVDQANEARLFTPFDSSKPKGLGLGLPISRSIVEAHGGRLTLVPSGGAGAAFQILLPLPAPVAP